MYITEKSNSLAILTKLKEIIDIKLIIHLLGIGRCLRKWSACRESNEDQSSVPYNLCKSQSSMAAACDPHTQEAKTNDP